MASAGLYASLHLIPYNRANIPPLSFFYRPDALPAAQPTASTHRIKMPIWMCYITEHLACHWSQHLVPLGHKFTTHLSHMVSHPQKHYFASVVSSWHTDRQTKKSENCISASFTLFTWQILITTVRKFWSVFYPHVHRSAFYTLLSQQMILTSSLHGVLW